MPLTYVSWAPHCTRSDGTAQQLGGRSFMVYRAALGSTPATVGLKYVLQAVDTLRLLAREHPSAVFVMTPPPMAGLTVAAYCWLRGVPFVNDVHSSAILDRRWQPFQWLQRWLCRRAATNIVHNTAMQARFEAQGLSATLLSSVPIEFGAGQFALADGFTAVAVCSFNHDEPIDELWAAARLIPDVTIYVTGDPKSLPKALRETQPTNVVLTGFLSLGDYGDLLKRAGVVIALTTRADTMLRSAYEAIYLGTPLVTSDTAALRDAFSQGAVHVANVASAIADGVLRVRQDAAGFRARAASQRDAMVERSQRAIQALAAAVERRAS